VAASLLITRSECYKQDRLILWQKGCERCFGRTHHADIRQQQISKTSGVLGWAVLTALLLLDFVRQKPPDTLLSSPGTSWQPASAQKPLAAASPLLLLMAGTVAAGAPTHAASAPTYPFLHLSPGCVVVQEALVTGSYPIRLGAGTLVHPRARLDSTRGPLTVGANCILEEGALLSATGEEGITLGDWNLIRVAATVEGNIGHANVVECRAHITAGQTGQPHAPW